MIGCAIYVIVYTLKKYEKTGVFFKPGTKIENAPVMLLQGFRLSTEEQEKYSRWLSENGYVFIPLFLRLPGLKDTISSSIPDFKPRLTRGKQNIPRAFPFFILKTLKPLRTTQTVRS
jgi:hypothetical protein